MPHYYLYRTNDGSLRSDSENLILPAAGHAVYEHPDRMKTTEKWDTVTRTIVPQPAPFITPVVTPTQIRDTLKVLLETTPGSWTAAQEKQALYGLLLLAFRDLKDGKVY